MGTKWPQGKHVTEGRGLNIFDNVKSGGSVELKKPTIVYNISKSIPPVCLASQARQARTLSQKMRISSFCLRGIFAASNSCSFSLYVHARTHTEWGGMTTELIYIYRFLEIKNTEKYKA